jgi:L-aspartate oxidase
LQGIALEHGLGLRDMEMMQFHPTVYIQGKGVRKQLLSEALRGEGARVVDAVGKRFLYDFHPDGELAPRNVVSQSIFEYCRKENTKAYLDVANWNEPDFAKRFPSIYFAMQEAGVNVPTERIPISPAFHYAMGGIGTDLDGLVFGTQNLYAVGEVAHTGVHGANRLASNSLLEGLVFSARAACSIASKTATIYSGEHFHNPSILKKDGDKEAKDKLRNLMWQHAGIIRSTKGLQEALNQVEDMLKCRTGKLLRLRLLASQEILRQALSRHESLGAHQMVAYPITSEGKI